MSIINQNKVILILIIILFTGCIEESNSKQLEFSQYLDGNVRSFDIINDTLFVASEDLGLMVYQIKKEVGGEISLDSLHLSNKVDRPVSLEIADISRSLIILDDYNYNYIGKVDFFDSPLLFSPILIIL